MTDEHPDRRWQDDVLASIDAADDLHVSPLREDGVSFGTPTWIWCVVVDGELFVRPYHGPRSRWYAAAMARPEGRIQAAGRTHDVTFEPAPVDLADPIDDAYRAKYATSPYLPAMLAEQVKRAGVRIRPSHPTAGTSTTTH
ncbi:MAG TPA: DUF2255 family protein [Propionibacteriaceae bacterium]|nr:DUF2255 family protein [Propionibacteriaceae bacterium]